jgi:outer membrane protein
MTAVWSNGFRAFTLVALLALAGCAVDQAKEVAKYRSVVGPDQPLPAFTPGEPLSLQRALELANQNSEQIGLQGEAYLQALIAKDRAVGNFLPTLSMNPAYSFRQQSQPNTGSPFSSTNAAFTNSLSGNQNLFRGFRDINTYRAANLNADQRRALLLNTQANVLVGVAQTYYQATLAERSVDVLKNSLAVQDRRVYETSEKVKAGTAIPLDVAQSEAQAAATRALLITAQNNVANGRSILTFLLGVPVQSCPLVDDVRIPAELPTLDQLLEQAAQYRQDIVAAVAAVEAAKYDVHVAIGQYYPSVSLNLNYILSKPELSNSGWWSGVLSANIPIFSAGQIEADVRSAWSFLRTAKLGESQTRKQVVQDVQISYHDIFASRERLHVLKVQLDAAAEALRQADERYLRGVGLNIDRLIAQDSLLSAQLQLTSQQVNDKLFHLELIRAIGKLTTRLPDQPTTQPTTLPAAPTTVPAAQ